MTRWQKLVMKNFGPDYARQYAERFREMAARGEDVHGEARFVADLVDPPARVLDAGCGTGRIAIRLAELGYSVVGVDLDPTMLREACDAAPKLDWRIGDLSALDTGETFDLVLVAGNTIPLLEAGTLPATAHRLAAQLNDGGLLVCGFGLDAAHLPAGCPVTPLSDVENAFAAAGLRPLERFATWDRDPYDAAGGYVVTVDVAAG